MALHNDIDPLPEARVKKIKNFTKLYPKIKPIVSGFKSKLASAIFLFGTSITCTKQFTAKLILRIRYLALSFFSGAKPHMVHISIGSVAVVTILTNLIVRYAQADYSLVYPEPASEIAVASMVDPYTPLINADGIVADKAYQNSGGAFMPSNSAIDTAITSREEPLPDNSNSTVSYEVAAGDNLTTLGWKFGVKISTLMYLNDITNADLVKPGQKLKIPPRGYEVAASLIAKKAAQQLAAANRNTVTRSSSNSRTTYNDSSSSINYRPGSSQNGYPWGYCTYYVASKRYVPPNWGNAKSWPSSAKRAGYSVGSGPAVGAIGVTGESFWGHVTFVESVNGDSVTVSEMNAVGWGKKSFRTLRASAFRAFIY